MKGEHTVAATGEENRRNWKRLISIDSLMVTACVVCMCLTISNLRTISVGAQRRQTSLINGWEKYGRIGNRVGPANARVQIVAFVDYECPFCKVMDPMLRAEQQADSATVAIVYRQLPLQAIHPDARVAAIAAECAADQGQFEAFDKVLYAGNELVRRHDWPALASRARLGQPRLLASCVAATRHTDRLAADSAAASALGVVATPTLLINGRLIAGTLSSAQLHREVLLALDRRSFWRRVLAQL